jgi:hypothetical protein
MEAANTTTSAPTSLRTAEPASAQPSNTNYAVAPNAESVIPSSSPGEIKVSNAGNGTPTDWSGHFNSDLKGYVQAKGFKDPESVVDSYRGLEKLLGAPKDKLLRLPDKEDSAEWGDIYSRLGRPQTPKDYKFDMPADTDPAFESWARDNFHKLGITQKQGENLLKSYTELGSSREQAFTQQKEFQLKSQEDGLKREWGAAFDQNIQVAKKAATQFGFDGDAIDKLEGALGYDGVMKFLQNIGTRIGESEFVGPNNPGGFRGAMTPEQAMFEIKELQRDKDFIQKWSNGDREAKARFDQLNRWARPG